MNIGKKYIVSFLLTFISLGMVGQDIYKNKKTFKVRKHKPKIELPKKNVEQQPNKENEENQVNKEDSLYNDSIEAEYQEWLKNEPVRTEKIDTRHSKYIEPDLSRFNPDRLPPPLKVTYHYDPDNVSPWNRMPIRQKSLVTFDFGQIISREARDRARDIKHHERAKRILENY